MAETPELVKQLARVARSVGKSLDSVGLLLQDKMGPVDRLVASTRVVPFKSKELHNGREAFVASTASVVGDVQIGERASAWYGATVRGDRAAVKLGRNSSVMDNAIVNTLKGKPVHIGSDVTIMPGAVVTSATVGDGAMVGMGAVVQAGAVVGADSFVDAGAVVKPGTNIPAGQLWTGAPAAFLRSLSAEEMSYLRSTAGGTAALGMSHAAQGAKNTATLEQEAKIRVLKLEAHVPPTTPISEPDADVVEYYKLTEHNASQGLWRDKEYDLSTEMAAREAEEVAADKAEEAFYAAMARQKRVGEAVRLLAASTRPHAATKAVADLEARDPEGAALLRELVGRVGAGQDKDAVLRAIAQVVPASLAETAEEHATVLAGIYDALSTHAKAGIPALAAGAHAAGGQAERMQ